MKKALCGSLESSDCLITVLPSNERIITIESIVYEQFGDQIHQVILDVLEQQNIQNIEVICNDMGALDYTIRARLITAINRSKGE